MERTATRAERIARATELAEGFRILAAGARLRGDAKAVARNLSGYRKAVANLDLLRKHFRDYDAAVAFGRAGAK